MGQNLRKEHKKLADNHKDSKYRFILTELDLAITFCDIALGSKDQGRSTRNTENARQAYKAAAHFLEGANFSNQMQASIQEKVARLRVLLRRVDRHEHNLAAPRSLPAQ